MVNYHRSWRGVRWLTTIAPGEECKGKAFGSVCLHMCVRMGNSKTIAPIDVIFLHKKYYALARSSSKMIWTQEEFI